MPVGQLHRYTRRNCKALTILETIFLGIVLHAGPNKVYLKHLQ